MIKSIYEGKLCIMTKQILHGHYEMIMLDWSIIRSQFDYWKLLLFSWS